MIDWSEDEQLHVAIEMSLIAAAAETRKATLTAELQANGREPEDDDDEEEEDEMEDVDVASAPAHSEAQSQALEQTQAQAQEAGATKRKTPAAAVVSAARQHREQENASEEDEMEVVDVNKQGHNSVKRDLLSCQKRPTVSEEMSKQGHDSDSDLEITHTSHAKDGKTAAELQERDNDCHTCCVCSDADNDGMLLCCKCGLSAHSWCYYKKGSKDEGDSISLCDAWICGSCGGPPKWERERAAHEAKQASGGAHEEAHEEAKVAGGGARTASAKSKKVDARKILEEAGYWYQGGSLMKKTDKKSPALSSGGADAGVSSPGVWTLTPASGGWGGGGGGSSMGPKDTPNGNRSSSPTGQGKGKGGGRSGEGGGGACGGVGRGWGRLKDGANPEDQRALEELLAGEVHELKRERNRLKAITEGVTDGMYADVQELLEILGVPYVLAPSEAEAQCAELERLKLVDGTITDDCDVFLFGGRHVFKNIFSDKKFVEWHVIENIEKELLLDREKLIMMGLLLGCDYFQGVRGVGIVNAIEILRAFPSVACLREFRNWVYSDTKNFDFAANCSNPGLVAARKEFASKHRGVKKNWEVDMDFPPDAVIQAFMKPSVDSSEEPHPQKYSI
jgi:DNA excision repair protein ERCC-5